MSRDNDALIIEALEKLEDPLRRGRFKATVATVCELTGLSRNIIRNRAWALGRLKDIKTDIRFKPSEENTGSSVNVEEKSAEDMLREKVKVLTGQNVQLYGEMLTLQEANDKLHGEMVELKSVKLRVV